MVDFILGGLIIAIIFYRWGYKRGFSACEKSNSSEHFREGFNRGKESVNENISQLLELPDDEIVDRLRRFHK